MISVVMPVYNSEKYLAEAIQSILNQTHKNFELICINDGSTDKSQEIIEYFSSRDARIVVINQPNKGVVSSLNLAISLAKYDYIARMDADDISHPTRLDKQIRYMTSNKDISILGTAYNYVDINGRVLKTRKPPQNDSRIKGIMLFGSPLCHPSVMFNKRLIGMDLYYDNDFKHCEDYELWTRLYGKFKFGNLPDVLLDYRIHDKSVSRENNELQIANKVKAINRNLLRPRSIRQDNITISTILDQKDRSHLFFQMAYLIRKKLK
ncbi:glycosyltransferase family 2 protein [Escherichia coli]|uniref:glycosyltransferase family 2 protein n=1 Tax=Escherichia coli TaxID=562 RepID=UPI0021F0D643|nr:glycosyltransferase [Escherichia coli]MCV4323812.1 glycosyltransferase [Escherichia coli]